MAVGHNTRLEVVVILRSDSAIQQDEAGYAAYEAYTAAGFDERKLLLVAGEKPTRFTLRRLKHNARARQESMSGGTEWAEFIARCSLAKLENYEVHLDDVRTSLLTITTSDIEDSKDYGPMLTTEFMARADFPWDIVGALALVGRQLSEGRIPFLSTSVEPSLASGSSATGPTETSVSAVH